MIEANRDSNGEVIDIEKDQEICTILRQAIYKVGIPTKAEAIDYIKGYHSDDSIVIAKFIDITVRFINAVKSDNLNKFLPIWEKEYKTTLEHVNGLGLIVVGNIADWTYEYLKGEL